MTETKFKTFKDLKSLNNSSQTANTPDSHQTTPSISSTPSNASTSRTSSIAKSKTEFSQTHTKKKTLPVSPDKDFQKVPNSVIREALAAGFFRGKSKQVWDYLWSVSRGAINPSRTVHRTRKQIKDGAGLGSMVTVDAAIQHLQAVGLIKVSQAIGSYSGNAYEIFSPEEVQDSYPSISSISGIASYTSLTQKVDILDTPENGISRTTETIENKDVSETPKTLFKDKTTDDDKAFAIFAEKFEEASRKLTGRSTKSSDNVKWGKLADLLILELELAARHTKSIASVPAFLTEVLRRRLILNQEEKSQLSSGKTKHKKANWQEVGKSYDDVESSYNPVTGEYDIKPLDEAGKAKALELVQEAKSEGGDEFLNDLKKWYLPEDWEWLLKNLRNRLK
jgi:hypothetical protein